MTTGVRGRLRHRRVAALADRERIRGGIWFDQAGRICQRCPACGTPVPIPDPPEFDDLSDFDDYARVVDARLNDAVFDHLLLDLCPTPERAL